MYCAIKKNDSFSLPDKISSIIRQRIEAGEYKPGKRLGTIRQFAKDFEVSPVTVIRALDILEEETLIERIPAKGVFVSNTVKPQEKQLSGCYVFPEKKMLPAPDHNENWGLNYELYRGLFDGAGKHKINMQFVYFEDNPSPEILEKQKIALRKFDFAIFPGTRQLKELCLLSAQERPTYYFCGNNTPLVADDHPAIKVDYDRQNVINHLCDYLVESSCKSAGVISRLSRQSQRALDFMEAARNCGMEVADDALLKLELENNNVMGELKAYLLSRKHEFIFVDYTELVPMIYEAAYQEGLTVGKDFVMTSVASGVIFSGLFPRLSYFRIPRYEMGEKIMENVEGILRNGNKVVQEIELPLEFIKGHVFEKKQ